MISPVLTFPLSFFVQPYPPYPGAAQVPPPAYPTMQQEQAPYPTGYPTSYPATTMDGYPPTTKVDTFTVRHRLVILTHTP